MNVEKIKGHQKYSEAKKEKKLVRRLAKRWSPGPPGSARIRVEGVEQSRKGARRVAVITSSGSRTHFNDPTFAIAKMINDARDPAKQPLPVRVLDPASIATTSTPHADYAHNRIHLQRIRKIAGYFLASWPAGPVPRGYFYLYPDKILYQAFTRQVGWINLRIPEEGINWTTLRTRP